MSESHEVFAPDSAILDVIDEPPLPSGVRVADNTPDPWFGGTLPTAAAQDRRELDRLAERAWAALLATGRAAGGTASWRAVAGCAYEAAEALLAERQRRAAR